MPLEIKNLSLILQRTLAANDRPHFAKICAYVRSTHFELDSQSFTLMLKGYKQFKDPKSAFIQYAYLKSRGMAFHPSNFFFLISLCAQVRNSKQARYFFADMRRAGIPINPIIFNNLLFVHSEVGEIDKLQEIFATVHQHPHLMNIETLCTVMVAADRFNRFELALDAYVMAKQLGIDIGSKAFVFTSMLKLCAISKRSDVAWQIWDDMVRLFKIVPNGKHLSALLNVMIDSSDFNGFERACQEMQTFAIQIDPLHKYGIFIKAYSKFGLHDKAVLLFDDMIRNGISPNTHVFCSFIESFRSASDVGPLLELWNSFCQDTLPMARPATPNRPWTPGVAASLRPTSINTNTNANANAGSIKHKYGDQFSASSDIFRSLLDSMVEISIKKSGTTNASAAAVTGAEKIPPILDEVEQGILAGQLSMNNEICSVLLKRYLFGQTGKHEKAMRLFARLKASGIEPDEHTLNLVKEISAAANTAK